MRVEERKVATGSCGSPAEPDPELAGLGLCAAVEIVVIRSAKKQLPTPSAMRRKFGLQRGRRSLWTIPQVNTSFVAAARIRLSLPELFSAPFLARMPEPKPSFRAIIVHCWIITKLLIFQMLRPYGQGVEILVSHQISCQFSPAVWFRLRAKS